MHWDYFPAPVQYYLNLSNRILAVLLSWDFALSCKSIGQKNFQQFSAGVSGHVHSVGVDPCKACPVEATDGAEER